MSKTAVIAVSTGCLDYLNVHEENLYMIRCKILLGEHQYDDYVGINADTFYDTIKNIPDLVPKSSMPPLGEITETFEAIETAGYTSVIIVSISSALSGTYDTCLMAKNVYEGTLDIHVFDTKNAAISEGFLTLEALRLLKEGKSIQEVLEYLDRLSVSRKQYFMVDSLRLLVKNGRLSGAQGFLGSLLKIKPILEVNEAGKIVPFEKVRTQRKALERMVDTVLADLKDIDDFVVTYNTSDNVEGFEYVKTRIEERYPSHRYYVAPITPVIGCHTGHGTVGIAFFNLDIFK